jgi:prophage antirepressor-like protein
MTSRAADGLPSVQYFYREGKPLRVVVSGEEIWFSVEDVFRGLGHDAITERRAVSLLRLMGIECLHVSCADGAKTLSLRCVSEGDLMRMFDKAESFAG